MNLYELQGIVKNRNSLSSLEDYYNLCFSFINLLEETRPTRIVSPTDHNYIFFQFSEEFGYKITRPLNAAIFNEDSKCFKEDFERFIEFITDLAKEETKIARNLKYRDFSLFGIFNVSGPDRVERYK